MYINYLQNNVQSTYNTLNQITQLCHNVMNTVLMSPTPKPDWFDSLNKQFNAVKNNASQWINSIAPSMTGFLPLQMINYGTTFESLSTQIIDITNANPNAMGADNKNVLQVIQMISALIDSSNNNLTCINTNLLKLKNWSQSLQNSFDDLSSIKQSKTELSDLINSLNIILAIVTVVSSELTLTKVYWDTFKSQNKDLNIELNQDTKTLSNITSIEFSEVINKEWNNATSSIQKLINGQISD